MNKQIFSSPVAPVADACPVKENTRTNFYQILQTAGGKVWITAVVLLQVVLVVSTFRKFLFNPGQYFFQNNWDGLKNYFTYKSYLAQPFEQGLQKFNYFNYPFGDYVLYTDNTPLFTVLLKLFSHYVYDVSHYDFLLFHLFLVSGIVFSTVLVYKILDRFVNQKYLVFFFSVALPWLNPQLLRLHVGHFNLSFSFVLLFMFYCLLRIFEQSGKGKSARKWVALMVAGLVLASFLHMYYLLVCISFIGLFFVAWFVTDLVAKKSSWQLVPVGAAATLLPLVLTFSITRLIDGYYHLRKSSAEGYGWDQWKLNFSAFYTPYSHNNVQFLVKTAMPIPYESYAYLGAFALFGLVIWLLIRLLDKQNRLLTSPKKLLYPNRYLLVFGIASVASVMIALGEDYGFFGDEYIFYNYFSAFFYVHKVTDMVTQFRCLGRFSWVFFWFFNFSAIYMLSIMLKRYNYAWFKAVAVGLLLLAVIDVKDTLKNFRNAYTNNLTYAPEIKEMASLIEDINVKEYQAILPVPYYHIGSEDYNYTIDTEDYTSTQTMQLSLLADLPLMANKMSRTPLEHPKAFFTIFSEEGISPELRAKLNDKPVLVLYNKSFYDGSNTFFDNMVLEPARSVHHYGPKIFEQYNMEKLKEQGNWTLYRWELK